jgi:hypothetical protein
LVGSMGVRLALGRIGRLSWGPVIKLLVEPHDLGSAATDDGLQAISPQLKCVPFLLFVLVLDIYPKSDACLSSCAMVRYVAQNYRRNAKLGHFWSGLTF